MLPISRIAFICLLLFLPFIVNAHVTSLKQQGDTMKHKKQSFIKNCEVGIGIGLSSNTIPGNTGYKHKEEKVAAIRLAKSIGQHYQAGVELSFVNMGYAQAGTINAWRGLSVVYTERIYGKPTIPLCLFGNYMFHVGYSTFYAGVAAGYMWTVLNYSAEQVKTENNASSFVIGGQVGYQYLLGKHFSLAAVASLRYCNLQTLHENNTYKATSIFYYPITVGASYLLGRK
ncbi:MAG: hypothetical protein ACTHJ0_03390 [Flavipsychrobacter sp.]